VRTAIWKDPVQGRRRVHRLNVEGDAQADLGGHGGEARGRFFVYQTRIVPVLGARLGRRDLVPRAWFGRISPSKGCPDDEVCIGDRYRVWNGRLCSRITQPRVTLLSRRHSHGRAADAALLTSSGRPGFYFRSWKKARIGAGDPILLIARGPERMNRRPGQRAAVLLSSPPRSVGKGAANPRAIAGLGNGLSGS
jgi:MOSC domain-containing protein YiiM